MRMGRSRVHPVLLLALVSAASVIIIASIFVNGNLAGENPQNFATAASLPYRTDLHDASRVLVGDATQGAPYFRIEPHWMDNFGERHCEECTMVEYSAGLKGTAGVAYVADKIYDLSEAKKVVVFVMGDKGGCAAGRQDLGAGGGKRVLIGSASKYQNFALLCSRVLQRTEDRTAVAH